MIKADLQIHSKYSRQALYMASPKILERLYKKFPKSEFYEGDLWWMQYVAIDGLSGIERILEVANAKNLKAIAITDHNTTIGSIEAQQLSKRYGVIVIPAMEISTSEGELLAYGLKKKLPFRIDPKDAIRQVRNDGGVVAIPHPFLKPHPRTDYTTFQKDRILELGVDAIDVFSPIYGFQESWSAFAQENSLAELGTSDAHMDILLGSVWTEFPDECKTSEDFIEAIKAKETKAGGIEKRKDILIKAGLEYIWKNGPGRFFIKY